MTTVVLIAQRRADSATTFGVREQQASAIFAVSVDNLTTCTTQVGSHFSSLASSEHARSVVSANTSAGIAQGYGTPTAPNTPRQIVRGTSGGPTYGDQVIELRIEPDSAYQYCHQKYLDYDAQLHDSIRGWTDSENFDGSLVVNSGGEQLNGRAAWEAISRGTLSYVVASQYGCMQGPPRGVFVEDCDG